MIGVPEIAASYGPKSALVLDQPVSKHGSEAADRLVMTSAEQCSDLDQETVRIRTWAAFSGYKERTMAKRGEKRERRSMVLEPDAAASISARRRFTSRLKATVAVGRL